MIRLPCAVSFGSVVFRASVSEALCPWHLLILSDYALHGLLYYIATEIASAFKKEIRKNRKTNDRVLRSSGVDFTKPNYDLAVISYVLSKITSKQRFFTKQYDKQMKEIDKVLDNLVKCSKEYSEKGWDDSLSSFSESVWNLEKDDPRFLTNLMSKGRLKVAATMYAQGVSLGLASEMTGIEKQEIMDYAGKTMMFDRVKDEKTVLERIKNARNLISR